MTRTARLGTIVMAIVLGLTAYLATPVSAEPTQEAPPVDDADAMALKADPAPTCVIPTEHTHWWGKETHVRNTCPFMVRVKVIIAWGFDSGCHQLWSGDDFAHDYGFAGSFDALVNC